MGPVEAFVAVVAIGTPAVIVLRETAAHGAPPKPPKQPKPPRAPKVRAEKVREPVARVREAARVEPAPRVVDVREPARVVDVREPAARPVTYPPAEPRTGTSILSGLASVEPDEVTPLRRAASAALLLGMTLLAAGAVGAAIYRAVSALG